MKDAAPRRIAHERTSVYNKKRASPSAGVGKQRASPGSASSSSSSVASGGASSSRRRREQQHALAAEIQRARMAQRLAYQRQGRPLFESEYLEDIRYYMHAMEAQTLGDAALIDSQPELDWSMRTYLVDFLVEVHQQARLRPETLYLTVNIIDRYISKRVVLKKHYQLVGCAALWIAAKFEDAKHAVPCLRELTDSCCGIYDESAFLQMEAHVLSTLGWVLGHPTAESWLRLFTIALGFDDMRTQHIARCVMEIGLYLREFVDIPPSCLAAGALLLGRTICGRPRRIRDESEAAVYVAELLDIFLGEHLEQLSEIIIAKYAPAYYSRASTVVREWYLAGRRFYFYAPIPTFDIFALRKKQQAQAPPSPTHSRASSADTSMDESDALFSPCASSASWSEDDMPLTPGKENNRASTVYGKTAVASGAASPRMSPLRASTWGVNGVSR